jgi:hypothetical protein
MAALATSSNVSKVEKTNNKWKQNMETNIAAETNFKDARKSSSNDVMKSSVKEVIEHVGKQTDTVAFNNDRNSVNNEGEAATVIEKAKKYSDTVIASASVDETEPDICCDDTKQKLNDMFDELVSEQNTMEIIESSEQNGTMRRRQAEQIQKNIINDETASKSVKSDTAVIENLESVVNPVSQDSDSLLIVPQSPREIRKMFQQPAVFQKSFSRVAEVEFPAEFQAGLKGKVRQSRETFLRQAEADLEPKSEALETRPEVPPSPRQTRRNVSLDCLTLPFSPA